MKSIGYAVLTVGFLLGSLVTAWTPENRVAWIAFLPALGVAVVGVALARLAIDRAASNADKVAGDLVTIRESLDEVVQGVAELDATKATIDVYDLHARIDERLPAALDRFVEARQSLARAHGLQAYAEVMNSFASGERYLNRAWSASVDGYIDEAHRSLTRSLADFRRARDEAARNDGAGG